MKPLLYSLRTLNDKTILSMDLTGLVDFYNPDQSVLKINLQSGLTTLKLFDYLNKPVVYDDGKVFFMVCSKKAPTEWAFKTLMNYAINKVDHRINKLMAAKEKYIKELVAA